MQKIALLGSTMLLLGLATQARANYVLQGANWNTPDVTADPVEVVGSGGHESSGYKEVTYDWLWGDSAILSQQN